MKKKWTLIISVCVVLALAAAAIALWLFSPGVRFVGNYAKFNIKEADCYIISGDRVIDRTTITLDGLAVNSADNAEQNCRLVISGYTDVVRGIVVKRFAAVKTGDRWTAQYTAYDDEDHDGVCSEEEDRSMVLVQLDFVEKKPVARIIYGELYCRENVYAICADSEAEAMELYRQFLGQ